MTKRDVLSIALKIIGIYCIVHSVTNLPASIYSAKLMSAFPNSGGAIYYRIYIYLVFALCAYVLIAFSARIAGWMIRDDATIQGTDNVWSGEEILMLVARMIGIYFLVVGLSSLGWSIVTLMQARSMELPQYNTMWTSGKADITRAAIQTFAAFYLLSGAKAMIAAIYNKWPGDELLDEEETTG